jgi:hypothetical protein
MIVLVVLGMSSTVSAFIFLNRLTVPYTGLRTGNPNLSRSLKLLQAILGDVVRARPR